MTLQQSFTIGRLRCHTLEGGRQRLDGGAMFGVVPRTLWKTRIEPDDRNRIPLGIHYRIMSRVIRLDGWIVRCSLLFQLAEAGRPFQVLADAGMFRINRLPPGRTIVLVDQLSHGNF